MKLTREYVKSIFRITETRLKKWEEDGILRNPKNVKGYKKYTIEMIRDVRKNIYGNDKNAVVITTATIKGGVGKTTMSILLSSAFRLMGYRVLYIDMDKQGNASDYFLSAPPKIGDPSIINVFKNRDLKDIKYKTEFGIDLIPSNIELVEIESQQAIRLVPEFRKLIEKERKNYDYIFIDTPTARLPIEVSLDSSDFVLSVLDPDTWSIDALKYIIEVIKEVNEVFGKNVKPLGAILNKTEKNQIMSENMIEKTEEGLKFRYIKSSGEKGENVIKVYAKDINKSASLNKFKTAGEFIFNAKVSKVKNEILYDILDIAIEVRNDIERSK